MKAIPHWITYTALRLLLIIVPLVILMLLGLPWWLSAIIAAVVGLCLSYLLLTGPRHGLARDLEAARKGAKDRTPAKKRIREDDDFEDHLVDDVSTAGTATPESAASGSKSERSTQGDTVDKSDDPGQLQH
ncbi:MAG: DUF4229 domain-containing protein [Microbacteriaceae bacterium]|nr:MAG: DUF4229 domain-containing protein [Microbacteriaceae bacterium]